MIYLASYYETSNFGPGRIINVAGGNKPQYINHIDVNKSFKPFIPEQEIATKYKKIISKTKNGASAFFVREYGLQLKKFENKIKKLAKEKNKSIQELLPFKNGDTLASWERKNYTNYRKMIGLTLINLGYKVIIN